MRVGLDLDNTLLSFQDHWGERYCHWFDREPIWERMGEWDALITATHFWSSEEFFDWAARAAMWDDMPWEPGAQGVIDQLLTDGHQVAFVTARHGNQIPGTERWFKTCGFAGQVELHTAMKRKSLVKCGVYVDDSPEVIQSLLRDGKNVIKFERPWNTDVPCLSAATWPDVYTKIKEIEAC